MAGDEQGGGEKDWQKKAREFEKVKARAKALRLRLTCTICGEKAKLNCPCGTTQYCSTDCQRIDWRDRGHRKACKKIRDERAAEAARAEAPTPPPSPPEEVFYGPAPRSHADEVRARIAAEHEAARARREANPEREPLSARYGSRCPICLEEWDVNGKSVLRVCCCRTICRSCEDKIGLEACALCRLPCAENPAESLARLRRHVENELPEAISFLGDAYRDGNVLFRIVMNKKKAANRVQRQAARLYKRAVELGDVFATASLGMLYYSGEGVKLDKKKARRLFRLAADRGQAQAQVNLGCSLVDIDKDEAYRYLQLAAAQGHLDGVYSVGMSYERGIGVEVDVEEAKRWYSRLAAKGHEMAIASLARLGA